jgi:Transglycosylase-like domain
MRTRIALVTVLSVAIISIIATAVLTRPVVSQAAQVSQVTRVSTRPSHPHLGKSSPSPASQASWKQLHGDHQADIANLGALLSWSSGTLAASNASRTIGAWPPIPSIGPAATPPPQASTTPPAQASATGATAATVVSDATSTATSDWACIRTHESGDRYNQSSAPSGAYGIVSVTWHSNGFSGWPYQAAPSVQDSLALKLYNEYGWQPWSTRHVCGV